MEQLTGVYQVLMRLFKEQMLEMMGQTIQDCIGMVYLILEQRQILDTLITMVPVI